MVTEHEQASRLARQWLINDAANVSLSIWYDWINDGPIPQSAEDNYGTVYRGYHNSTHPRITKLSYRAAHTLQRLLGGLRVFVLQHVVVVRRVRVILAERVRRDVALISERWRG